MAKKTKGDATPQDLKTCKICQEQSPLETEVCPKCGSFLPDELGIQAVIDQMSTKYKALGTRVYRITDNPFYASMYPPLTTGSLRLDRALLGGIPERQRVEIAGDAAAGKTTLSLHICAQVTQKGGYVLYIDKENSVDLPYALRIGIVPERFLIVNPESGSEALDLLLAFAPKVQLIVLDSVAACRSAGATNKEVKLKGEEVKDHANVGDLARLMSEFEPKLEALVPTTRCTYIFINQLRYKINPQPMPPSLVTPGGQAMTYMPTMKLWLRGAKDLINEDGMVEGKTTQLTIKKAKHIGVKSKVELKLGMSGIDLVQEVMDMSVEYGVVEHPGNWYYYTAADDTAIKANGAGQFRAALEAYPHIYTELRVKVKAQIEEEIERARKQNSTRIDEVIEETGEFALTAEEIEAFTQGQEVVEDDGSDEQSAG